MNRAYRVIFNHATGVWQCVSELARSKGKSKSFKVLAVATALTMSGEALADIELTDGQSYVVEGNRGYDGNVFISNPNTKLTVKGQLVFGVSQETNANISNQAVAQSSNDIAISVGQNATVTVDNASLENQSGVLALGLSPNGVAKLIGKNGAKITSDSIVSIANSNDSVASIELTGVNTTLQGTVINLGEQANSKGTLSLSDKSTASANQIIVGRTSSSTGTLNSNNASLSTHSLTVGYEGNGVANLTNSVLNLGYIYSLADGQGSTAKVDSQNNIINVNGLTAIGVSGEAILNSTKDVYKIQKNLTVGQEANSKGVVNFANSIISANDLNIAVLEGSSGEVVINGAEARLQIENELHIGSGGTGTLTLNQNSNYHVGHTYVSGNTYIGGSGVGGSVGTQGGTGTLILNDSTLRTKEVVVGNTGKGILRLNTLNSDDFTTGLNTNQISRNPNSQLAEIYLNGGEIEVELDQPNLFANFTKDNKIEIGEKGIGFVTGDHRVNNPTSANVTINPNAVITGNAGSFDINNPDIPGGFFKSGVGTLTISENTKQFAGDIAVARGTLKIDGNYTMNGENLIIGLIDWDENETFDNKDEYGKLVVTGKADVSNGNLAVYVDEFIKNGITADTVVKDVVTAGTLTGQFKQVTDNSPLVTFYADYSDPNKVHLTLVKPEEPQTPEVPPVVEPKPEPKPVEPQPVVPTDPVEPVQPEPTPPVALPVEETPAKPDVQPEPEPVEPTPQPEPEPVPSVRDVNFVTAVNENNNTDTLSLASFLDGVVADGSALSDALLRDTVNFDSAKLSQAVSELEPLMMGATNRILRDVSNQAVQALFDPTISRDRAFWATLIGKDGQLDAKNTGLLGYDNTDFGAITGIDTMLDRTRVGIAIAYVQSDADSTDRHDHSLSAKSKFGMIYADHDANDATRIYGQVAIGRSDIEGERKISTLTQAIAKSDYQADIINAGLGVEYRLGNSTRNITPFARLDYAHIRADGYQETGAGAYNLSVDKQSYETLRTTIGTKFNQAITPKLGITGTLAAAYDSGDDATYISAGFDGAGSSTRFVTASDATDRTIGIAGLGINYQLTPMASLSAGYQGQWQSGYDSHSANIGFKVQF